MVVRQDNQQRWLLVLQQRLPLRPVKRDTGRRKKASKLGGGFITLSLGDFETARKQCVVDGRQCPSLAVGVRLASGRAGV